MKWAAACLVVTALGVAAVASGARSAFPGRNGAIVFASNRAENLEGEVFSIRVAGGRRTNLTRNRAFDSGPVVSPDGRRILFRSSRDNFQGIWVMNADGSDQRHLAQGQDPAWSPNGSRIAYVDNRGRVSVMNADGTDARPLANGASPAWAPDGSSIAFVAHRQGAELHVVDSDGANERRLAPGLVVTGGFDWSPDGSALVFAGGRPDENGLSEESRLYVAGENGTPAGALTSLAAGDRSPRWSPNGRRIVFVRESSDFEPRSELFLIRLGGGGLTRLTRNPPGTYDGRPVWSPDGSRVAFARGFSQTVFTQLYVVNPDGEGPGRATNEPPHTQLTENGGPVWSPDGRALFYSSWLPDNDFDLFTTNPNGTGVRRLTNNALPELDPAWSPDGTRIAFVRVLLSGPRGRGSSNEELFMMRADGSGVRRLTRHGSEDLGPAWSPDGSRLVFLRRVGRGGLDLYTIRADGGGLRRLTHRQFFYSDPVWSPDGRTVIVAGADIGNGGTLLAVDVPSGRIRRLSRPDEYLARPDWSPSGTRIAYVKVTPCGGSCQLTDAWIANKDGSGARELAKGAVHVAWSPDGAWLAVDAGTVDIVRSDGSGRIHVTPETGAHDAIPDWQPLCTRRGGPRGDSLRGGAGDDLICGLGGDDLIAGGGGSDRLFGEEGDDRILAHDGRFDVIGCGPGRDSVIADRRDLVGVDCERVRRA